ncbi:MAG: dihydropteroate synthase [Lentimicrobiaceae bacterium]
MGILNVTPDSFFDGGKNESPVAALLKAEQLVTEGAAIIDIGALSTRPGAETLNTGSEIKRLIPYLKLIRKSFPEVIISIDTYRSEVARASLQEGADIINDISGGMLDPAMVDFMCHQDAAYILMHMQGTPETMQLNPVYDNVIKEVGAFFMHQLAFFKKASKQNIILDPGFGFGKNMDHNFRLLSSINDFASLGYPVLVGVSRKSMINKVLGTTPDTALNGTTVINTIALMHGAHILRVHDVKPAMEAIKLVNQFRQSNLID